MHLRLPTHQVTEVVEMGWDEHHPSALDGSGPNQDLDVVKIITSAAVEYASTIAHD